MGTFRMRFLMITGILFFIGSSQAQAPVNCSTGCWASRGECYWEPPTDPGLEPYWPWTCQHGEQGVDSEICYCGRCWGCKSDTAKCPNGKCSLRSPGPNFKPNGEFCNENDNCQCWEEVDQNPCKDLIDQKCKYDIGGICNPGPYLEYTEPTGYFCQSTATDKCQCYKKPCTDDGYCRTEYGGVCNETRPSADYYATDYMCNKVKNCTCWARQITPDDCIDPQYQCRQKFEGVCNTERPSDDFVPTGLKCLSTNEKDCQCWGKCPQDRTCQKSYNGGVCSIDWPGAGYKKTSYRCPNGAEGCICWEKEEDTVPCEKKSCPKVKGLKGKCGVDPPGAKGWVKSDYKCEENTADDSDCSCWVKDCKPKSKSKNCKGGYCYPYNMSPAGSSWVKAGYCDKFSKCTCWKQKSTPTACKQTTKCRKAGGACVDSQTVSTSMTLIKQKCGKGCTCVKKADSSSSSSSSSSLSFKRILKEQTK